MNHRRIDRKRFPRAIAAAVFGITLLMTGCGGVTVAGSAPTVPPAETTVAEEPPAPAPTPSENRVRIPGPPAVPFQAHRGAGTAQVMTYSWQRTKVGDQSVAPRHMYLVLEVTLAGTDGTLLVNPLHFAARTAQGDLSEPTLGKDGNEPVLASTELQPGETVTGIVTFDIVQEPVIIEIQNELGEKVGEIPIPAI